MITANPQFAPNGPVPDPDVSRPGAPFPADRATIVLAGATILYALFALAWSAAGRRDADYATAAAFAAACGSSATLIISILAAHAEREIASTRWGWSAIALAAGAATAAAIANLYAVWADGAVLWRPNELRWLESGSACLLRVGTIFLVREADPGNEEIAGVLGLFSLNFAVIAPLVIAARVALSGWPPAWSMAGPVLGTAAAATAALIAVAALADQGWEAGARPIGLFLASVVWAVSSLLQDVGVWSSTPGLTALGRWLFPIATLGLTAAILNPGSLMRSLSARTRGGLGGPLAHGPLPVAAGFALGIASIAALFGGLSVAADLSALTTAAVLLLFGRQAGNLRSERTRVQELIDSTTELERIANVDRLTGLPNRAALDSRLAEEMERAIRYEQPLSVLFVDIDYFKRVNDVRGHAVGDRVLQEIATSLQTTARSIDFVGRYGGEEFVVIAPGTWAEDALILAERLRTQVENREVDAQADEPLELTVSIGIAGYPEHADTLESLLERADQALYRSKSEGRNRVSLFDDGPDQ
jgi:diguanylate cyclase (GGDEF)-like protein